MLGKFKGLGAARRCDTYFAALFLVAKFFAIIESGRRRYESTCLMMGERRYKSTCFAGTATILINQYHRIPSPPRIHCYHSPARLSR
jgi:hypothetical protein